MPATGNSNKRSGAPVASTSKPKKAKEEELVFLWDIKSNDENDNEGDKEVDEEDEEEEKEDNNDHHKHRYKKPLVRDTLDHNELRQLIVDRNLADKETWTENDHIAISNLLVGRSIVINLHDPNASVLNPFVERLETEAMESMSLQKYLDPSYWLVHTLPNQENNGGKMFTYPTWPPGRVHSAGSQPGPLGIEAAASNVPPEWTLLLGLANAALHQDRGVFPVVPVGAPGALIGFAATADHPYFLSSQNSDHRRFVLAYMRGYLQHMFCNVLGSFSYSFFSTNTAVTRYLL